MNNDENGSWWWKMIVGAGLTISGGALLNTCNQIDKIEVRLSVLEERQERGYDTLKDITTEIKDMRQGILQWVDRILKEMREDVKDDYRPTKGR